MTLHSILSKAKDLRCGIDTATDWQASRTHRRSFVAALLRMDFEMVKYGKTQ
jgi:hypothetical protein